MIPNLNVINYSTTKIVVKYICKCTINNKFIDINPWCFPINDYKIKFQLSILIRRSLLEVGFLVSVDIWKMKQWPRSNYDLLKLFIPLFWIWFDALRAEGYFIVWFCSWWINGEFQISCLAIMCSQPHHWKWTSRLMG